MAADIQKLLDAAKSKPMSQAEKDIQRRSFAYGNAHIENNRVTRAMVTEAAERLNREK